MDRTGRRVYQSTDDTLLAEVALILIGSLAVTAYDVWMAGQGAMLLATGRWPRVPASRSPALFTELIKYHGRAESLWAGCPPWLFWVFFVLLESLEIAAVLLLLRWWAARRPTSGAAWGDGRAEKKLAAPEEPAKRAGRIVAGRSAATGHLLAGARGMSAIGIGPPGSGKTAGYIAPSAVDWIGPCVFTTVKLADLDAISLARPENLFVVAPAGATGYKTHRWSPVAYAEDERAAERMATWLAEASGNFADDRSRPWIAQAVPIVKGMLLASNLSGKGIEQFKRWISQGRRASDEVEAILRQHELFDAADEYSSPWRDLHADGLGSVIFTLNGIAKAYTDPDVRATASGMDFTAAQLLDSGGTLALVSPVGDADRFAPIMTAIIASVVWEAERRYNATRKALRPELGLLSDETGNFMRWSGLPKLLTTGRAQGIVAATAWHDLSQLYSCYGERDGNTIVSNSKLRVLFPGIGDPTTLKYFQELFGREHVNRASITRGDDGRSSRSTGIQETDLAPVHAIQQLEDEQIITQYNNVRPLKARIRWWFRDRPILERHPGLKELVVLDDEDDHEAADAASG